MSINDDDSLTKRNIFETLQTKLQSVQFKVYFIYALSIWVDRMWTFAVGLYLIKLFPESLQLTGIYGFVTRISCLLFGAFIGDWVDCNARLKVARLSLVLQHAGLACCTVLILLILILESQMRIICNGNVFIVTIVLVITIADIAYLANVTSGISIHKDWVVVIANGDEAKLADMNSVMRSIDLFMTIFAQVAVGQIMTFSSEIIAAIVILVWNIVSMCIEYFLLLNIYNSVPELARKTIKDSSLGKGIKKISIDSVNVEGQLSTNPFKTTSSEDESSETFLTDENRIKNNYQETNNNKVDYSYKSTCLSRLEQICHSYTQGWYAYFHRPITMAGIALALPYMSILGFGSITTGFAYSQGMTESILSALYASGAAVGILSSIIFPHLRRLFGLHQLGVLSFMAQVFCLSLCVASIWAPGSPFNINYLFISDFNSSEDVTVFLVLDNYSSSTVDYIGINNQMPLNVSGSETPWNQSIISISLFFTGIVASRFGLWMSDLTITQIFQENIDESERGIINGVQISLNMLLDTLKFTLVIIAPKQQTFGILIVISFFIVSLGMIFFIFYLRKIQSHFFCFKHVKRSRKSTNMITATKGEICLNMGLKEGKKKSIYV